MKTLISYGVWRLSAKEGGSSSEPDRIRSLLLLHGDGRDHPFYIMHAPVRTHVLLISADSDVTVSMSPNAFCLCSDKTDNTRPFLIKHEDGKLEGSPTTLTSLIQGERVSTSKIMAIARVSLFFPATLAHRT